MNDFGIEYKKKDWTSKTTLKVVLLHNANPYGTLPVCDSVHMKETLVNKKDYKVSMTGAEE